jgi:hypothetical protein
MSNTAEADDENGSERVASLTPAPCFGALDVTKIRIDEDLQTRAGTDSTTVEDYAGAMAEGQEFPAVIVYFDEKSYWLCDGFHRLAAAKALKKTTVWAEIRRGTRTEAIRAALMANHDHGLRRSNQDKRRCVAIALKHFPDASDRALAELCGVGNQLIGHARGELCDSRSSSRRGRDGKVRRMPSKGTLRSAISAGEAGEPGATVNGSAGGKDFTLVDGSTAVIRVSPCLAGWLEEALRKSAKSGQPKEWVLLRQQLLIDVGAVLATRLGITSSRETAQNAAAIFGLFAIGITKLASQRKT